jgi:ADP-ribosylglycohydrolase
MGRKIFRLGHGRRMSQATDAGGTRLADTSNDPQLAAIRDRVRGTILASACANSLGGSSIGLTRKEILTSTGFSQLPDFAPGLTRSQLPEHKPGDILADSFLALTLAESLIRNGGHFDQDDLRKSFTELLESPEFLASGPGAVCLGTVRCVVDAKASGLECFDLPDPSTAVRAFPCGCLPGSPTTDSVQDLAIAQCSAAYSDKSVMAAAAVVADSINFLIGGGKIDSAAEVQVFVQRELAVARSIDLRFADAWDGIAPDLDYSAPAEELPYSLVNVESNVTEMVPTAMGIFLIFRHSLEKSICAAALSGGDTDTVAALVGAFAGAYHGAKAIPSRWSEAIAHRERINEVANNLAKFWN